MKRVAVSLTPEAEADLENLYNYILNVSSSTVVADAYLTRIENFLNKLDLFPLRGTVRDSLRPGIRIIGFERSLTIAFLVEEGRVIVLRIFAGGRDPHHDPALKS